MHSNIAVIIPTLGNRPELLNQAINSALSCEIGFIAIISPNAMPAALKKTSFGRTHWYEFEGGLPEAINFGFQILPKEVRYVTWLGDDDFLEPRGYREMRIQPDTDLLIGACNFISIKGERLRTQKVSKWRLNLWALSLFASPIAQPASLFSRRFIDLTEGIDARYRLAFDQDFFTRGIALGAKVQVIENTLASYRVHSETLSNTNWEASLEESGRIRSSHAPRSLVWLSDWLQHVRSFILRRRDLFRSEK